MVRPRPDTPDAAYSPSAFHGEAVAFGVTAFREGHDRIGVHLRLTSPSGDESLHRLDPAGDGFDRWWTNVALLEEGTWTFHFESFADDFATWHHAAHVKVLAGVDVPLMLEMGALLCERGAAERDRPAAERRMLTEMAEQFRADAGTEPLSLIDDPRLEAAFTVRPLQSLVTVGSDRDLLVERERAGVGAWYEFFPRSEGAKLRKDGTVKSGTFRTASKRLPAVARMGFDVVYLPPIHPIGRTNRKGPNNSLTPGPGDPGSPWAIGAAEGGHDAVHPDLGTLADFRAFVRAAAAEGLEVALDLALQASPDHPWVTSHPEWFTTLPDGSIAYAENPPKKYQDIYPINFDNDPEGIRAEVLRIVRHWIAQGVRIFRVDNPHTKPPNFWEWLITEVKKRNPEVLFLSEAFTRPARLYGLARIGFTQSYTYFTWKTEKWELEQFGREIADHADEARPNLFVNTPDILHASLQHGGPGMFALRAALAATLAPTWGVYSGYELYEHVAVAEGSEEYLHSEKYELRPRDHKAATSRGESLEPWITSLNEIRRRHPALQQLRHITFHHIDNSALIAYSKFDPVSGDRVIVVINLNPFGTESSTVWLDMPALGFEWQDRFTVVDEVSGQEFHWGQANYVQLEPWHAVAHILALPPLDTAAARRLAYRMQ